MPWIWRQTYSWLLLHGMFALIMFTNILAALLETIIDAMENGVTEYLSSHWLVLKWEINVTRCRVRSYGWRGDILSQVPLDSLPKPAHLQAARCMCPSCLSRIPCVQPRGQVTTATEPSLCPLGSSWLAITDCFLCRTFNAYRQSQTIIIVGSFDSECCLRHPP